MLDSDQTRNTELSVPKAGEERCSKRGLGAYLFRFRRLIAVGSIFGLAVAAILLLTSATGDVAPNEQVPLHPIAPHSMPPFITAPGTTDVLLVCMAIVLVGAVMGAGVFFFWLHSLPERMVHNSTKVHFDIVAVLGLLSLFTHVHLFWVAALLLALVKLPEWSIPDFSMLLGRIAAAIEGRSGVQPGKEGAGPNGQRAPVQEG